MADDGLESFEHREFERQRRVRFSDLGECFIGRVLLGLVDDSLADKTVTVDLDFFKLFTGYRNHAEAEAVADFEFENSDRITESASDVLSGLFGTEIRPH